MVYTVPSRGLGTRGPCPKSPGIIRGSIEETDVTNPTVWLGSFVALTTAGMGSEGSGGWSITGQVISSAEGKGWGRGRKDMKVNND